MDIANNNFGMEMRLKELDPSLHKRFTDTVVTTHNMLFRYKRNFPNYNDHSGLHSMAVIDFCNHLIGRNQLLHLNADELYILLMSCHLHDAGMGISPKEYDEFSKKLDFGTYFETHRNVSAETVIRDFHHEFSALFIEKYSDLLELPSPEHTHAVMQVARGHRKTDLFDPGEYPADFTVPNGSRICLPYLAALIRLADEVDVGFLRSSVLLFDIDTFEEEEEIFYYYRTRACEKMQVTDDAFIMYVRTDDPVVRDGLVKLRVKIQETLDLCAEVVKTRTPYTITQTRVEMKWL